MTEFRKPRPSDKMDDHAEQHGYAFDEISNLKDSVDNHSHSGYISSVQNTILKPPADDRFITLKNQRPKEEDGSYADKEFGLEVDIDEGNTYKNQFIVGNRHGFALKVLGGGGKTTWFGGRITQKGDSLENEDARDYIIRKNLNDATEPLVGQIEHNEDRINALEAELEAVAETKSAGEWQLVSQLDFDVRGTGKMTLSNTDLTAPNNELTLHATDLNNVSHGFSGVEVGDLVEVLEEHEVLSRSTGDYGLYEVKAVNGMTFTLELQQGRGMADTNKKFYVKFFYLSEDVNIAELDDRYSMKEHTHSSVPSHNHDYASSIHTHEYAPSDHLHPAPKQPPPGRPFVFGSATQPGEFYADDSGNVYFNRDDQNGNRRVMPTYPDFTWSTPCKITVWNEHGQLKYASEVGKTTDYKSDTMVFKNGNKLYNKGLTAGETYHITVEGYW